MRVLDSVSCGDDFTAAATIEGLYGSPGGGGSITGNDAFLSLGYGPQGQTLWTPEQHAPVGTFTLLPGTTGIRARNYVAGSTAVISAALSTKNEPVCYFGAGGQSGSSSVAIGYGTTLPASPADQELYVLVDSVSNPSYQWLLRYNASSASLYKWELIGGCPAIDLDATGGTTSGTAYGNLSSGAGPAFTVPYGGDFNIRIGAGMAITAAAVRDGSMSFAVGATPASDTDRLFLHPSTAGANDSRNQYRETRKNGLTAGDLIQTQFKVSNATATGTFDSISLSVLPYRLG